MTAAAESCGAVRSTRPRPNQALQRTGSVCGFTVLSRFQLRRRSGRPLNTSSLGRTKPGGWAPLISTLVGVAVGRTLACSPLSSLRRPPRLQLAGALVQPGPLPVLRVRPNQALRRTGGVCGFTLLFRFQPASSLWPAAELPFVRRLSFRKLLHALPPLLFVGVGAGSGALLLGVITPIILFFVAVFIFGDMGGPLFWPILAIIGLAVGAAAGATVSLSMLLLLWFVLWLRARAA